MCVVVTKAGFSVWSLFSYQNASKNTLLPSVSSFPVNGLQCCWCYEAYVWARGNLFLFFFSTYVLRFIVYMHEMLLCFRFLVEFWEMFCFMKCFLYYVVCFRGIRLCFSWICCCIYTSVLWVFLCIRVAPQRNWEKNTPRPSLTQGLWGDQNPPADPGHPPTGLEPVPPAWFLWRCAWMQLHCPPVWSRCYFHGIETWYVATPCRQPPAAETGHGVSWEPSKIIGKVIVRGKDQRSPVHLPYLKIPLVWIRTYTLS